MFSARALVRLLAVLLVWNAWSMAAFAGSRDEIDLSGPGWKIWHDDSAQWKNDDLYPPPVDIAKLPYNPPTGGWAILDTGKPASVPGTAEEYLQKTPGPEGDITGVTWWSRSLTVPASSTPRRLLLRFEAVRQRAEVFINQKLVGYDMIGNTPFEVDISDAVKPGDTAQLAVRITDPGGNFDWHDKGLIDWGKNQILFGHGFGGITGRIKFISCDPAYVDDIYVQNTPAITAVNAQVTLRNAAAAAVRRDLVLTILDRKNPAAPPLLVERQTGITIPPGSTTVNLKLSCPNAKLWDPDHPNLYVCQAELLSDGQSLDAARQTFGFRWFEAVGTGTNAMFRLNGKRIVLRSAISWGFFPINGLIATDQIATRQITVAKQFGLNMLNFHRAIGQPIILEKADELGLLYYEEPGNYDNGANNSRPIPRIMAHEKVMRMVKRDRSHPSLIIYSMSNETGPSEPSLAIYASDMKDMHELDPSRLLLRSSGLRSAIGIENEISTKWHYLPFDDTLYKTGWYDDHHAGGPAVYSQDAYKSPTNYYHLIHDPQEINFWGEEGAISTPPRLGLIKEELAHEPNLGWDGAMYLSWYKMFDDFLDAKNLRSAFPTVDSLCKAMGDISIEHQGRTIQIIRLNNDSDAYCINGWESEILEDHSGIVDCFRNPKGDPAIMAYYNQPLYVAVMPRNQVIQSGGSVLVDFHLINELDVKGPHRLAIAATDPAGKQIFTKTVDVSVTGGDTYGQLLAAAIEIPAAGAAGPLHITAQLLDSTGAIRATGRDDVYTVDWKSSNLTGAGAILDSTGRVAQFLTRQKGLQIPNYADSLPRLDWVVITDAPNIAAPAAPNAQKLLDRVRNDGTTLIVLDNAPAWLDVAKAADPTIHFNGSFRVGTTWAGGVHFVRQHPLFKDLPVNCGMDWPYQAVVHDGNSRSGLLLEGDDLAAGAFHANTPLAKPPAPIALGTAVGVVHTGKGKIIVSTLDIASNLTAPEGPPDVARKLLCNFIEYANAR